MANEDEIRDKHYFKILKQLLMNLLSVGDNRAEGRQRPSRLMPLLSQIVRRRIISLSLYLSMFYIITDYESPLIGSTYEGTLHPS